MIILEVVIAALGLGAVGLATSARIIKQYEHGLIFRLGRVREAVRGPGLTLIVPGEPTGYGK
jgi:regulator of protease activity HflC (stomatin/prohibitin superfamily)